MNSYAITAARWVLVELQAKRLDLFCQNKENTIEFKSLNDQIKDIEAHIEFCEGFNE